MQLGYPLKTAISAGIAPKLPANWSSVRQLQKQQQQQQQQQPTLSPMRSTTVAHRAQNATLPQTSPARQPKV